MTKYHCIKCNKTVTLKYDAIYTPDGPLCDGCSGEKRDSHGYLISVRQAEQRGQMFELALIAVIGLIIGALIFVQIRDAGLLPYLKGLIP